MTQLKELRKPNSAQVNTKGSRIEKGTNSNSHNPVIVDIAKLMVAVILVISGVIGIIIIMIVCAYVPLKSGRPFLGDGALTASICTLALMVVGGIALALKQPMGVKWFSSKDENKFEANFSSERKK